MKSDFIQVIERLSKVEESNKYQSNKIDEIHKVLIGNGRIGLVDEWNQWKGGIKLFGWLIGIAVTVIGTIGVLAFVK